MSSLGEESGQAMGVMVTHIVKLSHDSVILHWTERRYNDTLGVRGHFLLWDQDKMNKG